MPVRFNLGSITGSGASKEGEDNKWSSTRTASSQWSNGRGSGSKRSDEEDEEAVRKFLEDTLASLEDSEGEEEEGEEETESSATKVGEEEEEEEGGLDLAFFDKESEAERLLVHQCNVSERTAERLGEALAENKHVKTLSMQDCEVASAACLRLLLRGVTASAWGGLQTLTMDGCGLTDSHAQCLVESLRFCKKGNGPFNLHTLALPHNALTAVSCAQLALLLRPPLTTWVKLRRLDLSGNRVGDEGAAILALALTDNGTMYKSTVARGKGGHGKRQREGLLREIDLSFNRIGPRGMISLCESLAHECVGLRTLGLRGNRGGAPGATALAKALPHANTLVAIDFRENNIGDVGASELIHAVQSQTQAHEGKTKGSKEEKPALRLLQLGGNNLHTCSCQGCSHARIDVACVETKRGNGPLITLHD